MVYTPISHPKMIIFSGKTPCLLGKPTILGNPHVEGLGCHPHGGESLAGFLVAIQQRSYLWPQKVTPLRPFEHGNPWFCFPPDGNSEPWDLFLRWLFDAVKTMVRATKSWKYDPYFGGICLFKSNNLLPKEPWTCEIVGQKTRGVFFPSTHPKKSRGFLKHGR